MERKLEFKEGIIEGSVVRELVEIFPELKDSFRQRKSFDEYYYDCTNINLTLDNISKLNDNHYHINIGSEECLITW